MTFDEAITGEFKELFKEWAKQIYSLGYEAAKKDCIKIAEEATVITCKDCKHWNEYYRECNSPNWDTGTDDCFVVPAGFYCGWAERRTE